MTCARCTARREFVEELRGILVPVETCSNCGERWLRWEYVKRLCVEPDPSGEAA